MKSGENKVRSLQEYRQAQRDGRIFEQAVTPQEYEAAMAEIRQEGRRTRESLACGECPECASKQVAISPDSRQAGNSLVVGVWHNVRCPDCGYVLDIIIPDDPS